jgi:hypothetical protein
MKHYFTKGKKAVEFIIDDEDYERVTHHSWFKKARDGVVNGIVRNIPKNSNEQRMLGRFVLNLAPDCPLFVDHIDGNVLNNRKANLRLCTNQQNLWNRKVHKNNKLGVKGVERSHKKYRAICTVNHKRYRSKSLDTIEEAMEAYKAFSKQLHGEFSRTWTHSDV